MEKITSTANAKIKFFKSLHDKSIRKSLGLVLLEGENLISELDPQKVAVSAILACEDKLPAVSGLIDKSGAIVYIIDSKISEYLSFVKSPSGIFTVCDTSFKVKANDGFVALLDGIRDPGNVGTIIRTCAALGVTEVLGLDCADVWNDKVIRSSMGGVFKVNFKQADIGTVRKIGYDYEIFKLDMNGENLFTKTGFSTFKGKKIMLAVGSEASGLSEDVKNLSGKTVSLPMPGDMESLNAAVAFSVAAYTVLNN